MTIPIVRKRAKRPKVKTGCRTCRARHVKCGEERPVCHRCTAAGKTCEGYDAPTKKILQTSARLLPLLPTTSCPDELCLLTPRSLSTSPGPLSSLEGYALDYFRLQGLQELPGSSWLLSWDKLILPFCRIESTLLHAATAVGSLQRALEDQRSDVSPQDNKSVHHDIALQEYSKTISSLRTDIESSSGAACQSKSIETILTSCLLLFCFEVLQGEDVAAAVHLRNGLRILAKHLDCPSAGSHFRAISHQVELTVSPRTRIDVLTQTFVRLDADLTLVNCDDTYLFPVCRRPIPPFLQTLEEAMVHLDALERETHDVARMVDELSEQDLIETQPQFLLLDSDAQSTWTLANARRVSLDSAPWITARIEKAKRSLEKLRSAIDTLPVSVTPAPNRMLLEIHFFLEWYAINTFRDWNEMDCDRFDEGFKSILPVIEQYCALQQGPEPNRSTRRAFTFGTSVTSVVCIIAEKSRNSLLRRRAIELLRTTDLSGAYDGEFMASFMEFLMDMEERWAREMLGLSDDHLFHWSEIPAEARFFDIDCYGLDVLDYQYYKRDVGRLVFLKTKDGKDGELEFGEMLFPVTRRRNV